MKKAKYLYFFVTLFIISSNFIFSQSNVKDSSSSTAERGQEWINKWKAQNAKRNAEPRDNYSRIQSFNTEDINYDRFAKSPCFEEIGFNPTWDQELLEKRYIECEKGKNKKDSINAVFIIAFILVIIIVFFLTVKNFKK